MDLEPGQTVGHYEVQGRLGQGGMSNVYLARDTKENRDVVLKFPHESIMGDIATHERFVREVKIGQLLHHPHIQALYSLEEGGPAQFLVLEYVPGNSLRHVIREHKHPHGDAGLKWAIDLGIQIGSALAHAHSHNVTHRDLKPENIIVTPDHQAKVMDFGIALLKGARRVTWGPLSNQVGTPDYMAPEQIEGGRGDARTDVYALGMILYELIADRLPFEGDNALAVMNQHVNVKAPPISRYRKDVEPAIDEIVMKAIRRRPADRWQTPDEMLTALQDWKHFDYEPLRVERDKEADSGRAAKALGRLPMAMTASNMMVAVVIVVIMIVGVVALSMVHPHGR
jgi:eukaryotic-like serine/threonine-protein kinase